MSEIKLEEVLVAKIEPNDVLVVRCAQVLTKEQYRYIGKTLANVFPNNKIVIFDSGLTFEIAREKGYVV